MYPIDHASPGKADAIPPPARHGRGVATRADRLAGATAWPGAAPTLSVRWRGAVLGAALCGAVWMPWSRTAAWVVSGGASRAAMAGADPTVRAIGPVVPVLPSSSDGVRIAASAPVAPLADMPEPRSVELTATTAPGDDLARVLERAGVGSDEAARAAAMIGAAVDGGGVAAGTRIALTLGRRPNRLVARPLEAMALRPRLDLALSIARRGGRLTLSRRSIAVDRRPLRLGGLVGRSLDRSARAAGVPAAAVEAMLRVLAGRLSLPRDLSAADSFDLVIARERAATGETRLGELAYVALDRGDRTVRLMRWGEGAGAHWYDANGLGEERGAMAMPVAGHVTSGFGMRLHPILGFSRMHQGIDIGAPAGTPVFAVADGIVRAAGWSGGYGNFIRLAHRGALATGYGHLSRIVVRPGEPVGRGQLIGYVGSTGLSTGPHLHWEVWRGGVAVDPMGIALDRVDRLSGPALAAFRARLAMLTAARAG